ncbi:MAG: hypothetical protein N3A69_02195 [Leptospiraceae bacterium]|nr:hypothetical protein [Leptospiraceae bacterium]
MFQKILILYFFISLKLYSISPEKKEFLTAIETGNSEYFKNITIEKWKAFNKPSKSSLTPFQKYGIKSIPALIGGIQNPSPEVRKEVYLELLFPKFFSSLEMSPQKYAYANSEWNELRNKIRPFLIERKEPSPELEKLRLEVLQNYNLSLREAINSKDFKAIANMTPEFFDKSNAEHEKTVIGRFGKRAVKTLVKALALEEGPVATKMKILDALMFNGQGGPEKVIPKMTTRAKRAEELFLIADRLEGKPNMAEFRLKLLDVAQAYIETAYELEGR